MIAARDEGTVASENSNVEIPNMELGDKLHVSVSCSKTDSDGALKLFCAVLFVHACFSTLRYCWRPPTKTQHATHLSKRDTL